MKCPMMWNPLISKLYKQWSEKEIEADIINNGKMKGDSFIEQNRLVNEAKKFVDFGGL